MLRQLLVLWFKGPSKAVAGCLVIAAVVLLFAGPPIGDMIDDAMAPPADKPAAPRFLNSYDKGFKALFAPAQNTPLGAYPASTGSGKVAHADLPPPADQPAFDLGPIFEAIGKMPNLKAFCAALDCDNPMAPIYNPPECAFDPRGIVTLPHGTSPDEAKIPPGSYFIYDGKLRRIPVSFDIVDPHDPPPGFNPLTVIEIDDLPPGITLLPGADVAFDGAIFRIPAPSVCSSEGAVDQLAAQAIQAEINSARATETTVQLAISNPGDLDAILNRWSQRIKDALDGEVLSAGEKSLANAGLFTGRRRIITQVIDAMVRKGGDEGLKQAIEKIKDPKYAPFLGTNIEAITQHLQTVAREAANERRMQQDAATTVFNVTVFPNVASFVRTIRDPNAPDPIPLPHGADPRHANIPPSSYFLYDGKLRHMPAALPITPGAADALDAAYDQPAT
jgi:hypothetical protein